MNIRRLAAGFLTVLVLTVWGGYPLASPDIRDVRVTDGFWFDAKTFDDVKTEPVTMG